MAAPATVPDFLDIVRRSSLVPEARLASALDAIATGPTPGTTEQMCQALIRVGALTRFQARQLKLGRYKRFEVAGKYRLLELLGAGGMGAVYLCEHKLMRRLVAVKVLPQEKLTDPSNLERFYREARAVAALDHPNIVRAYDIDKFENTHFLVMEFVDGRSLQEIVALHGKMDPYRVANYIAQAAVGLEHAAGTSMVHRDIKPGNLLLERTGVIKILDMGLARFFNDKTDNLTAKFDENCVLGTADYLAPEQAMSNEVDIRADIYALGGTMYFCLTGVSPAPDGTVAQKLMFHQTRDPKPVTDFRSDVPEGILAVLAKMMAKKPDDRFSTPMEVADALAEWAEAVEPTPPPAEMPDLCPAVLALTGHAAEKLKAGTASRTSGYGRNTVGAPSTRTHTGGAPGSGGRFSTTGAGPDTTRGAGSTISTSPASGASVPLGGTGEYPPLSGGRPSTVDLSKPPISGVIDDTNSLTVRLEPRRFPWILAGVCAVLALGLVAVVAYLALGGRPTSGSAAPAAAPTVPQGPDVNADLHATLRSFGKAEGREVDLTFTVVRTGENKTGNTFFINSKQNYKDAENLTLVIRSESAMKWGLTPEAFRAKFDGAKVRVRGQLRNYQGQLQIEIAEENQLEVIP